MFNPQIFLITGKPQGIAKYRIIRAVFCFSLEPSVYKYDMALNHTLHTFQEKSGTNYENIANI